MKKALSLLGLATFLPFAAVAAENLSYTYVEGGYTQTRPKQGNTYGGWTLNGSYALNENFHVFGGFSQVKSKGKSSSKIDDWRLGLGYNFALSDNTDFVARIAYQNTDPEDITRQFKQRRTGSAPATRVPPGARAPHRRGGRDRGRLRIGGSGFRGYNIEAGVNHSFSPRFAGYAMAGYEDYLARYKINPKGEFYGRVGAQFYFTKNIALGGDVKVHNDRDVTWTIGPRITW